MRIAIDALGIHNFGGGRTATLSLLEGLFLLDRQNQYRVYLSKAEPVLNPYQFNVQQVVIPFKNRFLQRVFAQLMLPIQTRDFDLVHFAKNLGVFGLNSPSIVTIYDLTTLVHPDLFPKFDVWYWRSIERITLRKAARVIAISETTAHDLKFYYDLPTQRIKIIYPSIDARFKPASSSEIYQIRQKYHLSYSYILHVGRIDLKKKLTLLVEAYYQAKKISKSSSFDKLVLVGEVYPKSQDDDLEPTIERFNLTCYFFGTDS
jgi:glycosyltransferase involved in cell wall biosynthesis